MKHLIEITVMEGTTFNIEKFYISDYAWTSERLPDLIIDNNNRNAYSVKTKKNFEEVEEFLGISISTTFISIIYLMTDVELTQAILFLS